MALNFKIPHSVKFHIKILQSIKFTNFASHRICKMPLASDSAHSTRKIKFRFAAEFSKDEIYNS